MNAIEVKNVTKIFKLYDSEKDLLKELLFNKIKHKEFKALNEISFDVEKGDVFGILGGNGSGKSTVLNIINGTMYPTEGKVKTKGKVSLLNVGAGIVPGYTGIDNIYYKCGLMGLSRKQVDERLDSIIEFSELGEFIYHKVNKYSSGMRSKLGFAISIHIEPEILIVDEALAVGDSRFAKKCHAKMDELKEKGITIVYVSHSHNAVRSFCNNACWINNGELIGVAPATEISKVYEQFMFNKISLEEAKIQVSKLNPPKKVNSIIDVNIKHKGDQKDQTLIGSQKGLRAKTNLDQKKFEIKGKTKLEKREYILELFNEKKISLEEANKEIEGL